MNEKGKKYENIASNFLKKKGYTILYRNYFCLVGEIDIIATKNDVICFVEVRYRSYGLERALGSISTSKKRKLIASVDSFLSKHEQFDKNLLRFDLIAISKNKNNDKYRVMMMKDFFGV